MVHYSEGFNFLVRADSLPIIPQLPAEAISDMPVDTLMLLRGDQIVVADITTVPADLVDSVWVKVARDQLTLGWIHERDLLPAVSPDDPISQFIDFFSDAYLPVTLVLLLLLGAAAIYHYATHRKMRLVFFNDIPSFYPSLLCLLSAVAATLYSSIQMFRPETWQHFYFNPTLNPYAVPLPLQLFLCSLWGILIVGLAALDDVRRHLPLSQALPYLIGLGAACAVAFTVFSFTTTFYLGYLLLAALAAFTLYHYFRNARARYTCGHCGTPLTAKGNCPHCGAYNE